MFINALLALFLTTSCAGFCSTASLASDDGVVFREDFSINVLDEKLWQAPSGVAFDSSQGYRKAGSILIGEGIPNPRVISRVISGLKAGQFLEAECWVKTEDAQNIYFTLEWMKADQVLPLAELWGGIPGGHVAWRFNPVSGTENWRRLRSRGAVPIDADGVRISLRRDGHTGKAWFDDVLIRIASEKEIEGELDRNPVIFDPAKLKPSDYVTVRNGHLWHRGKRLRLWMAQCNLVAANHRDIDFEVARFKDHGFNGYRSLWWKPEVADYTPGDLSEWDKRDYLIASLGRNGIYFWCDLLNSCQISPELADIIDNPETKEQWVAAVREMSGSKGYHIVQGFMPLAWDPRSQAIYFRYMERLLNHKNHHNGLTYAEDPTFFCWELTNEEWWIFRVLWGQHLKLPEFFQKQLYNEWNNWLARKYKNSAELSKAWNGLLESENLEEKRVLLLPLLGDTDASGMAKALGLNVSFEKLTYKLADFSKARASDLVEFLMTLHINYKKKSEQVFRSLGRKGIGSSIVPLIYDTGYSGAVLPFYMHSFSDATAAGTYGDMTTHDPEHPTFPFTSGLTAPPKLHGWIDTRRVKGKPAFIYENMAFQPQKYKIEWIYGLLAMTAVQDFDVVDFHYYGPPLPEPDVANPHTAIPLQYVSPHSEWDGTHMRQDETLMSAVKAAGEIFKHGYLKSAPKPVTVTLGRDTLWSLDGIYGGQYAHLADKSVFQRGFQWAFNLKQKDDSINIKPEEIKDPPDPVVMPTSQIAFRWKEGIMVIDDPRAKALVGFTPPEFSFADGLSLSKISVRSPEGMPFVLEGERYVGIAIVSLDGKPLAKADSVLLSAANTSFNSGFKMDLENMVRDTAYVYGLARSITDKGDLPVLVGRVGLTLKAGWLRGRYYRMTDFNGNTLAEGVVPGDTLTLPNDIPVYLTEISRK